MMLGIGSADRRSLYSARTPSLDKMVQATVRLQNHCLVIVAEGKVKGRG